MATMVNKNEHGYILIVTSIFVVILSLVSITTLRLMSESARLSSTAMLEMRTEELGQFNRQAVTNKGEGYYSTVADKGYFMATVDYKLTVPNWYFLRFGNTGTNIIERHSVVLPVSQVSHFNACIASGHNYEFSEYTKQEQVGNFNNANNYMPYVGQALEVESGTLTRCLAAKKVNFSHKQILLAANPNQKAIVW